MVKETGKHSLSQKFRPLCADIDRRTQSNFEAISPRYILILFFHLQLGLPNPSRFSYQNLSMHFSLYPFPVKFLKRLIILDSISLTELKITPQSPKASVGRVGVP
jgi:hypothetical protein